eukprot:jgi/Bigna1/63275/fgenesh1_kg.50_\
MGSKYSKALSNFVDEVVSLCDSDENETLDYEEYCDLMTSLQTAEVKAKFSTNFFSKFVDVDDNNDGKICSKELYDHFKKLKLGEKDLISLLSILKNYHNECYRNKCYVAAKLVDWLDLDGSGELDTKEIGNMMSAIARDSTLVFFVEDCKDFMKSLDSNKDTGINEKELQKWIIDQDIQGSVAKKLFYAVKRHTSRNSSRRLSAP